MLWDRPECPVKTVTVKSVQVDHTQDENSQESALPGTLCENGTVWKSEF